MNKRLLKRVGHGVAAAGVATLLAACGGGGVSSGVSSGGSGGGSGGGGGSNPDPFLAVTQVPTSATTSVAGVFAFLTGVITSNSETADPLTLGDVTLATSETDDATPF